MRFKWVRLNFVFTYSVLIGACGATFGGIGEENAMALEQPKYTVIREEGDFELRSYEPYIVAETTVEGAWNEVGNEAFRRLAGYIFGGNRKRTSPSPGASASAEPQSQELSQKIAMTAPVTQTALDSSQSLSQKIQMTVPVSQTSLSSAQPSASPSVSARPSWVITFSMPSEFTLATLPEPNDARVRLRSVPAQWQAAIRYSGTWSQERYEEKLGLLRDWMAQQKLQPTGEPTFARYNPPMMPWFLRKNEILIPVARSAPNTSAPAQSGAQSK